MAWDVYFIVGCLDLWDSDLKRAQVSRESAVVGPQTWLGQAFGPARPRNLVTATEA